MAVSKDYFAISEKGDTTDDTKLILRRDLAQHLWRRGEPLMHVVKDVWQSTNILFVVTTMSQVSHFSSGFLYNHEEFTSLCFAHQVSQVVTFIKTKMATANVAQSLFFVYAGRSEGSGEIFSQLESQTSSIMKDGSGCCRASGMRLFDLGSLYPPFVLSSHRGSSHGFTNHLLSLSGIGRDFSSKTRSIDLLSETLYGIDQVCSSYTLLSRSLTDNSYLRSFAVVVHEQCVPLTTVLTNQQLLQ